MPKKFKLVRRLAPGDTVILTALVRDLKKTYGDDVLVDVDTNWPDLWTECPHLTRLDRKAVDVQEVVIKKSDRQGITLSGRGHRIHFMHWMYHSFIAKTGLPVSVTYSAPELFLTEHERTTPPISGRYWVVFAGGKTDVTVKQWSYDRYQQLVDCLRERGLRFVQSGASKQNQRLKHINPPLRNVLNVVGWGGMREMMWQIYHAEGVICPVTAGMHMAAAFDKPCVVIAGGREEPWWEHYSPEWGAFGPTAEPIRTPHRFLHTVNELPCCQGRGCWKNRIVRIEAKDIDKILCSRPVNLENQVVPQCMDMITVEMAADAVMSYYATGRLPPINEPSLLATSHAVSPVVQPENLKIPPAPYRPKPDKSADSSLFDHPEIGGKITVCVLCYGDYYRLHRACLESILKTVPEQRLELRVATNEACMATLEMLQDIPVAKHYCHATNDKKYPVMREMFHDPAMPLSTRYLVWFDDDTQAINPKWCERLLATIIANREQRVGMYGWKFMHKLHNAQQRAWFAAAHWWRGRYLQDKRGDPIPNGDHIHFSVGWFWAAKVQALLECDIPDVRLGHNGGDITIGEQLWQHNWKLAQFNAHKELIFTPPKHAGGRRGYEERFPWQIVG